MRVWLGSWGWFEEGEDRGRMDRGGWERWRDKHAWLEEVVESVELVAFRR